MSEQEWSASVRFTTTDQATLEAPVSAGESLLTAARNAGWELPSMCRAGSCGMCRARLVQGPVIESTGKDDLAADISTERDVLLCSTQPSQAGPIEIALPYGLAEIGTQSTPVRSGRITELDRCAANTIRMVIQLDDDPEHGIALQFDPGQYAYMYSPDADVERPFSFANCGNWEGTAELVIKLRPQGRFSGWLDSSARVSDAVRLTGPCGTFTLQDNGRHPRWFVCGGTGIAPALSMMRRMAEWMETQPVRLIWGVVHEGELFGLDTLAGLNLTGGLTTDITVEQPSPTWPGSVGTAVDVLHERLAEAQEPCDIYICGSPAFVNAARASVAATDIEHCVYGEAFA